MKRSTAIDKWAKKEAEDKSCPDNERVNKKEIKPQEAAKPKPEGSKKPDATKWDSFFQARGKSNPILDPQLQDTAVKEKRGSNAKNLISDLPKTKLSKKLSKENVLQPAMCCLMHTKFAL